MEPKKILCASGIVAATAAAASLSAYLTTKFLVRVAVDREGPRAMQKAGELLSGTQTDNLFLEELEAAAERLEARENEVVEITGRDGPPWWGISFPAKVPSVSLSPCMAGAPPGPKILEPCPIFGRRTSAAYYMRNREGKTTAAVIIWDSV